MIVGSGLLARAFAPHAERLDGVCIYAAGVSNSSCVDATEFERDRVRLEKAIAELPPSMQIVYFSTCSVHDPWSQSKAYTRHKVEMENLVRTHTNHLVVRLPQIAGSTPNPHTLLNYLYNRIVRSERFELWQRATRNIIDVVDVANVVGDLLRNTPMQSATVNVANARSVPLPEIVSAFEAATGRKAVFHTVDRGGDFPIDVSPITESLQRCGVHFDDGYLNRTIERYYGRHR